MESEGEGGAGVAAVPPWRDEGDSAPCVVQASASPPPRVKSGIFPSFAPAELRRAKEVGSSGVKQTHNLTFGFAIYN